MNTDRDLKIDKPFEAAFKYSSVGMAIVSTSGEFLKVNKALCKSLGYSSEEFIKLDFQTVTHKDDKLKGQENLKRMLNKEIQNYQTEKRYYHKAGNIIWGQLNTSSVLDENGEVLYFVSQIEDITERVINQKKLEEYTYKLERSNQDLNDFAYIASHDLKEPLRGLANNAIFLKEDNIGKLDARSIQRIDRISFLCTRMEKLVNDLLHFARLKNQDMIRKESDINNIIIDIRKTLETTLEEANANIVVRGTLPTISCEEVSVIELFRNLIVNAIKYNKSKKKIIEIGYEKEIMHNSKFKKGVFFVRDNGIGIEKRYFSDIFRIFKRLNNEDDSTKGTGVGLTFVKKVVERHEGSIWLESGVGKGSSFYFTLD